MLKFILVFLCAIMSCHANAAPSPLGYWQTIDDVTGKPQSVMQIVETSDHTLSSILVKAYPRVDNKTPLNFCTKCTGSRHNQPLMGMAIMTGLKPSKNNQWIDGRIIDPTTGKVYHCSIKPIEHGSKLSVRGYIGIPLFGRTQTWIRVPGV